MDEKTTRLVVTDRDTREHRHSPADIPCLCQTTPGGAASDRGRR